LVVEAFTLAREACRRGCGLRHYDVQLLAGAALCERTIVEMQTGEGKTLTAALPLYVFALFGKGAYLATSNDYLARRDADWLKPSFALLGLTVDAVTAASSPEQRRSAYRCDVTYGTGKEFGFDFLRDRLKADPRESAALAADRPHAAALQRSPFFMLVDEADNVLIDDAGTPLIIAAAPRPVAPATAARYVTAAAHAPRLEEATHYEYDALKRRVELTTAGRALVRGLPFPPEAQRIGWPTLYEDAERAVLARRNYKRETQYVVRNGEIVIVDEFTGRIAEGRKWRDGLHQAIEAQERLPITDDGGQAARITVQEFFRRFPNLAGMTGTAANSAGEFYGVYEAPTFVVPTNRPSQRRALPPLVFASAEAKWQGIVAEVRTLHDAGRPVLIGTRSIEKSQLLAQLLDAAALPHVVLNAREIAREAEIVAGAGQAGQVTVATNMAGRGTDILLGPGVAELGGLHVILSEMHEASRIDRQFIGRGGRQGDPGSFRFFLSLDDELLTEALGERRAKSLSRRQATDGLVSQNYFTMFRRAQRIVERRAYRQRKELLYFEKQRNRSAQTLGLDPYLDLPG
jgi:preprotein translocase subunit SecA